MTEVYNTTEVRTVDFAEGLLGHVLYTMDFTKPYHTGGSTVDRDIIPPFALGSSLKNEVKEFLGPYSNPSPAISWDPKHTLFVFWFGVNDITMTHVRSKPEMAEFDRPPLPQIFHSYSTSINKVRRH